MSYSRLTGLGAIALAAIYCLRRRLIERNARARAARAFAALGGGSKGAIVRRTGGRRRSRVR